MPIIKAHMHMKESQKRQFDSFHALSEQTWREWDHKTRHEWKLSFSIWAALLVAIGTVVKVDISPTVWLIIIFIILLIVLFILHLCFLRWVQLKLRSYRQELHYYRKQMQKLLKSSWKEKPFRTQAWCKQVSLWIQLGITLLLICIFVAVVINNQQQTPISF